MLEGQLGVFILKKEEEQITSVCQSSHSTLLTLLGRRGEEHTCMVLSIMEVVMIMSSRKCWLCGSMARLS